MSGDLRNTFKTHAGCVPTSWLDSLLTGPDACLPAGKYRYTPSDIDRLLLGIKNRIEAFQDEGTPGSHRFRDGECCDCGQKTADDPAKCRENHSQDGHDHAVVIYFDDIGYAAKVTNQESHRIEFVVYEIEGVTDKGQRLFHKKDSPTNPDPVETMDEADVYLHGSVKWDGCSNWYFDEQNRVMLHGCSREDLTNLGEVMAKCWDYVKDNLESWSD